MSGGTILVRTQSTTAAKEAWPEGQDYSDRVAWFLGDAMNAAADIGWTPSRTATADAEIIVFEDPEDETSLAPTLHVGPTFVVRFGSTTFDFYSTGGTLASSAVGLVSSPRAATLPIATDSSKVVRQVTAWLHLLSGDADAPAESLDRSPGETIAAAASVEGIQETTSAPEADQKLAEPQFEYAPDVVFTTASRTDDHSDVSTDQPTVSLIQAAEIEIRPIPTTDQVFETLVAENESLWGRARLLYDSGALSEVAQIDFPRVYESYAGQLDRAEPNLRVLNETVLEVSKWVAEADSSTTQLEVELLASAERLMTTGDDTATDIGREMAQRVANAVAAELVDPTGDQLRQVESDVLEALGWRDRAADRLEGIEALGYRDSGAVGGFLGGALAYGVTRDPTMIPGGASLGAGKSVVLRAMFGLLRSYFRRRT